MVKSCSCLGAAVLLAAGFLSEKSFFWKRNFVTFRDRFYFFEGAGSETLLLNLRKSGFDNCCCQHWNLDEASVGNLSLGSSVDGAVELKSRCLTSAL